MLAEALWDACLGRCRRGPALGARLAMSGLDLLRLLDSLYLVAVGTWLGSLGFAECAVIPMIHRVCDPVRGRALEREVGARCGLWGAICGAIALPALVCGTLAVPEMRGPGVGVKAIGIVGGILAMLSIAQVIGQRCVRADTSKDDRPSSERVGGLRVVVSGLVGTLLVGLLVAHAFRSGPRSQGIVELDPKERYLRIRERATKAESLPAASSVSGGSESSRSE